jgi:hypothetical protein
VVTGMVSEWAPASLRDPAGAMLLVSVGVLVVAVARSPQARAAGRPLHPGQGASAAAGRG